MHELTGKESNVKKKIEILYNGHCKALTNFMFALTRLFERKAGHYSAENYKELVKMYGDM